MTSIEQPDVAGCGMVVSALLRRLADDLHILLDCEWLIAWEESDAELHAVYRLGPHPDPEMCRGELQRILDGAVHPAHDRCSACAAAPALVFPVRRFGCRVGAIATGERRRGAYTSGDVTLMAEACKRLGDLLEEPVRAARMACNVLEMERRQQEMEAAREVQNRFFPLRLPSIPGVDCYGECRPCGEVGGDFFDLRAIGNGKLALAIGDVSGKGVPAAMIMAGLQVALRGLSGRKLRPVQLVEELNALVCAISPDNYFATMFYAQIDLAQRRMTYVNAGHEPPLVIRGDGGRIERAAEGGTVLGLSRRVKFVESTLAMHPGDWLVAFTDGITEARAADGEYFEAARVLGAVAPLAGGRASEAVAGIMGAVDGFAASPEPADDRTAVAVRLEAPRVEQWALRAAG